MGTLSTGRLGLICRTWKTWHLYSTSQGHCDIELEVMLFGIQLVSVIYKCLVSALTLIVLMWRIG